MIITAKTILDLNEKHNIIENLSERELNNPEGTGFDVRVGEVHELSGEGFLGVSERQTPTSKLVASIQKGDSSFDLKPGMYVLVKTMEKVNLPKDKIEIDGRKYYLIQDVQPRGTLARCGVQFIGTKADVGYSGHLIYALKNIGGFPFRIELGARFANLMFKVAVGNLARSYEGQWAGGRVSAQREVQN